jgi:regulator of replication initiation timing
MNTSIRIAEVYVDKSQQEIQKEIIGLLSENETLRNMAAELTVENTRLREQLTSTFDVTGRESELLQQTQALQEYATRLANLYVASYQLQGTVTRELVLAGISEILINLIGTEDFGVYELRDGALTRACSFGPVDDESIYLRDRVGMAWQAIETGELLLGRAGDDVVVCIPLKVDGTVNGVIAIFSLLAHKTELAPLDHELFALLGTHAATALYSSTLQLRLVETSRHAA